MELQCTWMNGRALPPRIQHGVTLPFFLLSIAMSQLCSVQNHEQGFLGCAQHCEP